MSALDWLTSPPLWFGGIVVALWGVALRGWLKRDGEFRALCAKYVLRISDDWGAAPDPEIRGLVFSADYSMYIEGLVQGVPVVAFDYSIGIGRGRRYGSGVGVKRMVLGADKMFRSKFVRQKGGWTFVYAAPFSPFMFSRLSPDEAESMWLRLLMAPAQQPEMAEPSREPVPCGVHIRPRRLRA